MSRKRKRTERRASSTPVVAPFNSCISCYRGDTTTVVCLEGNAEFIIAATSTLADIPVEEASATFQHGVRLCRDCAAETEAVIVEEAAITRGEPVFTYRQPFTGPMGSDEDEAS